MASWLMEHVDVLVILGFLLVIGVLNCLSKPEPKRDLKTPEPQSLDRRFKDAYRHAIFGDDDGGRTKNNE